MAFISKKDSTLNVLAYDQYQVTLNFDLSKFENLDIGI